MLLRPNDELKGIWVGYARMWEESIEQTRKKIASKTTPTPHFLQNKVTLPRGLRCRKKQNKTKTTPMQNGLTAYRKGIQGAP